MKNLLLLFVLLTTVFCAQAQSKKIFVEGPASDPYITHVIQPKENFYSIGRIYNISPRVYAPYNNMSLEGGLTIGQMVRIPLNEINFSKDGAAAEDEVIVPLYKRSGGNDAIFGYLKVKKELSALAVSGSAPKKPVDVAAVTPAPKKENAPAPTPAPKQPEPSKVPATPTPEPTTAPTVSTEGFFKSAYLKQHITNKNVTVKAGVFKSTSGWNDGKFYCFHNRAAAGNIVAVQNPANGKTIYAKVLDVVPDISENVGIDLRLSNAAAEALQVSGTTFTCELSY
ncbi:MAG: hypothetical protein KF880_02860 [Ferruginibacter sp.]|nr:hypothetical protein [Ferruginibacter sp.]